MSEELVVEQCSPTMAGLKTGNLFSCPAEDTRTLRQSIRRLNQRLVPCGIRLVPVKSLGDRELIYMYRPEKLRRDLREQGARAIAAAAAQGAEPLPASLENSPRLTPFISTAPKPPAAT